jgi:hypothetical protein
MSPALITTASGVSWEEIAADRQKYRDATIATVEPPIPDLPANLPLNVTRIPKQLLTLQEIKITETSPEELIQLLASSVLTAKQVVTAFLRHAGLAQKLVLDT